MSLEDLFNILSNWLLTVPGDIPSQARNTNTLWTQLFISFIIGITSFLLFCLLRKKLPSFNPVTYYSTYFGWILPLLRISEEDFLEKAGLDAYMSSFLLCLMCSLYGVLVLIPINAFGSKNTKDDNTWLTMPVFGDSSSLLFAHAFGAYLFTGISFKLLHRMYKIYSEKRWDYLKRNRKKVSSRTLMITGIPKNLKDPDLIKAFFDELNCGKVDTVHLCLNVDTLQKLILKRIMVLDNLEINYTKWLKNPCDVMEYDPSMLETLPLVRDPSEFITPANRRPKVRDGIFGWFGKKHDAIRYYRHHLNAYDEAIQSERDLGEVNYLNVGFVTFEKVQSAHILGQMIPNSIPFKFRTSLAPEPQDIIWNNITQKDTETLLRGIVIQSIVLLATVLWGIPVSVVSSLLTVRNLEAIFPFLASLDKYSHFLYTALTGFLPTVATISFFAGVPYLMSQLGLLHGSKTNSKNERFALSKYFSFLMFNVIFAFIISGTLWRSTVNKIVKDPTTIPELLATALPGPAPFFINFIMILGMGYFPLQLLQIGPSILYFFQNVIYTTPRHFASLVTPVFADYCTLYGQPMLVFVLVTTYSTIAPLILVFGAIYYAAAYFVVKHQFLYVFARGFETGGSFWPHVFRRIIIGIFLLQITMIGILILRKWIALAIAMVPLLIASAIIIHLFNKAFPGDCVFLPADHVRCLEINEMESTETSEFIEESREPCYLEEQYYAAPSAKTDYRESPQNKFYGVLDSSIQDYNNPAIYGRLPQLWLPVKARSINENDSFLPQSPLHNIGSSFQKRGSIDNPLIKEHV